MQSREFDLSIGDILQIENRLVTVVDIENGEVIIHIDEDDSLGSDSRTRDSRTRDSHGMGRESGFAHESSTSLPR